MTNKKNENLEVDEIILESEEAAQKEKLKHIKEGSFDGRETKSMGDKISMILILVLLALSIIQSIELISLRAQIKGGQFNPGNASNSSSGPDQSLPSQQGGC